jgi:hypothetical protein
MSSSPDGDAGRRPRRDFLRLAALAPLAVGCAAARSGTVRIPSTVGPPPPPPGQGLEAVRAFPLPAEAEPAFVFRAAGRRPPLP